MWEIKKNENMWPLGSHAEGGHAFSCESKVSDGIKIIWKSRVLQISWKLKSKKLFENCSFKN